MAALSKGAAGEVLAARFLREKGYQILTSNYRCRLGEVDIIARDGAYIAFVEVKTRRSDGMYAPREAVTAAKQQRLIRTAALYLMNESVEGQPRFDVVEILAPQGMDTRAPVVRHIENAF